MSSALYSNLPVVTSGALISIQCINYRKYATVLQFYIVFFALKYAKICASIYKNASASEGLVPQTSYRGFAPGTHWGTSVPQTPYFLPPPNPSNLATPLPSSFGLTTG